MNSIFVTFNPGAYEEESTALRLQTIANLYDLRIEIPMRPFGASKIVHSETIERLKRAEVIIAFCLGKLSPTLRAELNEAIALNQSIVVVYDKLKGKPVDLGNYPKIKWFELDFAEANTDEVVHGIATFLSNQFKSASTPLTSSTKSSEDKMNAWLLPIVGVLAIALGMIALFEAAKNRMK